ncbi:MAG: PspC domain-containing protein [Streptosporangiaceae bacterium]|nr:PspC domain-containing protein [Actinomycetota bacterium]
MTDGNGTKVLVRSRGNRMLAGVCAGLADYLGVDVTVVRVLWVIVTLITGGVVGLLAYLAAWAVIPDEGQKSSIAENLVRKNSKDSWSG